MNSPTSQGEHKADGIRTTCANDMPDAGGLSPLLTVREVAKILGIHVRTVWRLAKKVEYGEVPFPKPLRLAKKTIRWRRQDLEKYLDALAAEESAKNAAYEKGEGWIGPLTL